MSNLHVLTRRNPATPEFDAVAHVAIPVGSNSAGVAWQVALVNSGIGGKTVLPDGDGTNGTISAAEKAQIAAGSVYEVAITLRPQTAGNVAGVNAYLDAQYAAASAAALAQLQQVLQFYGGTR